MGDKNIRLLAPQKKSDYARNHMTPHTAYLSDLHKSYRRHKSAIHLIVLIYTNLIDDTSRLYT